MTELFLTVLQMSLMAAGVVLIALPLRWLFRRLRLPALACELLWLVAAVRMLLPVGLVTGPFSVLGWLTPAVQEQTEALARTEEIVLLPAAPDPAPPAEPAPSFALPEAVPAPEEAAPAAEGLSVLDVLAWLWLAGVLAVWGYMALAWLRLRRRLATAVWRGSAQMGWWWVPFSGCWRSVRLRMTLQQTVSICSGSITKSNLSLLVSEIHSTGSPISSDKVFL